ncbi:hypothetical protein V8D89_004252 [Ganoderma adspersum]
MVEWQSPDKLTKDGAFFDRFMHSLFRLYLWEFIISLPFDWQYLTGKRKFKWPLVFYFSGQYFLLFTLIGIPVNCQALYTYNQIFGNATIGLASITLSLRIVAVWSQVWYIVVSLVCLILGQWALLLNSILLNASWVPGIKGTLLRDQSKIVKFIFEDGLIYFMIFMLIDLNAVLSIIANVPTVIASTIVASRVVRRLVNYTSEGVKVLRSRSFGSCGIFTFNNNKGESLHLQAAPGEVPPSDTSSICHDMSWHTIRIREGQSTIDLEASSA